MEIASWESSSLWRLSQSATSTLDAQVVVLEEKPEAEKIVSPVSDMSWKPSGGLWTSTLNAEGGEWLRWLHAEGYSLDMPRWGGKLWRLEPVEAKVYVIWSPKQLYDLQKQFPHPKADELAPESLRLLIDWPSVAEAWDAVHIPNPWPWRFGYGAHMSASMFFYSMDAECTCWFRWCFKGKPQELDPEPFLAKLGERQP